MSAAGIGLKKNTNLQKDMGVCEEKPAVKGNKSPKIRYDKDTLVGLRSSPASKPRFASLADEFLNMDGVWDPEAWHTSKASRANSPAEQKIPDGKKKEHIDDGIELAPHRRSFRQGCHVSSANDVTDKPAEKYPPRPIFEKKSRLTGRASGQRKTIENNFREHNDSNNYGDYEKPKREKYDGKVNSFEKHANKENRHPVSEREKPFEKERVGESMRDQRRERESDNHHERKPNKPNRSSRNNEKDHEHPRGRHGRRGEGSEKLPEWVTDGPTSQLDTMEFTGCQDIEDEKKAYAKTKKKVKMTPCNEIEESKPAENEEKPSYNKPTPISVKEDEKPDHFGETKMEDTVKSQSNFDIADFFSEVNFYPPHLFQDDLCNGNGIRSRFTQYFQSKSRCSSRNSDHGSGNLPLLPDEIFSGQRKSPVATAPYFTPIKPASPVVSVVTPVTPAIGNVIGEQPTENAKGNKKVKGRLNVEQLEFLLQNGPTDIHNRLDLDGINQNAFDGLVRSMKDAGQLPDKPAPVVAGLPDHLLPKPPKKSSPTFEKLKRTLSRSPSPVEFMKSVSTIASILASNPAIDSELNMKKNPMQLKQPEAMKGLSPEIYHSASFPEERRNYEENSISPYASVSTPQSQRLPPAFLPTSVLKKMHSEKQRESPTMQQHSDNDGSFINGDKDSSFSDLLVNSVRSPKPSAREVPRESNHSLSAFDNLELAGKLNLSEMEREGTFHSAPPTPRHQLNSQSAIVPLHSVSAPNTPDNRFNGDPPVVHRLTIQPPGLTVTQNSSFNNGPLPLMVPSAFKAPSPKHQVKGNDFGVIGSGIPQKTSQGNHFGGPMDSNPQRQCLEDGRPRGFADPRLAPGNGVIRNTRKTHSPVRSSPDFLRPSLQSAPFSPGQQGQSQQQQLLQAQRMASIHQAQLHQQQKLQQIASQAKMMQQQKHVQEKRFTAPAGVRPLLPDPDPTHQPGKRNGEEHIYQQQQHQQIQAFQQQQRQQQEAQLHPSRPPSSNNGGMRNRQFQNHEHNRNSPPLPLPMQQPGLQGFPNLNRPQNMQNMNLAAQALVQQQLLNQAARARFIAQTQLLQQQPQVMHALMAQAALVRGQAQAQAAMMLNQKNLQAMAEQMGLRPPFPHMNNNNKQIPTPMLNHSQHNHSNHIVNSQPSSVPSPNGGLSKWFGKDILNLLPKNNPPPDPSGKILSVEELERKQRSS